MGANTRAVACLVTLGLTAGAWGFPAAADEIADFYRGRQMELVIGHRVGGGYDLYARLIGRFMTKHLPGHPQVIPRNMTGAGSRKAANWLYNIAPRDGSVIGVTAQTTPLDQALKRKGVSFDASKFNWIGNPIVDNQVFLAWHTTGIKSFREAKAKSSLFCGSTNASTNPAILPKIINHIVGTHIRLALGYPSGKSVLLAMERGEANCMGSYSWATAKATAANLLSKHDLNVLVQWGPKKDPEISSYAGYDVPLMPEYAKNDIDRGLIKLISAGMSLGRPMYAPPGVPQARVAALRKAFDEIVRDPEFLAYAKKARADIKPISGVEVQAIVGEVLKTPPNVIAKMREIIGIKE